MSLSNFNRDSSRYIEHSFPAYNNETIEQLLNDKLILQLTKAMKTLESEVMFQSTKDYSVYTGSSGLSLLFLHLSETSSSTDKDSSVNCFNIAKHIYDQSYQIWQQKVTRSSKRNISTFLEGDIGLQCVGSVILIKQDKIKESIDLLNQILSHANNILNPSAINTTTTTTTIGSGQSSSSPMAFEILYGVCGYLQGLLFLKKSIDTQRLLPIEINDQMNDVILKLVQFTIQKGVELSKSSQSESPLMYEWHSSKYLGAAHGLSGIMYMLLDAIECLENSNTGDKKLNFRGEILKNEIDLITGTVGFIMSCVLSSGNYPSRKENPDDKLVQWCHGSPGVILTLMKLYRFFKDEKYLSASYTSALSIWNYGLLTKGCGLCHGISGNAFSFLSIYQNSKNLTYLHYTIEFAKSCIQPHFLEKLHIPDNPLSLFEGKGGLIWLLNNIIQLKKNYNNDKFIKDHLNFPTF